MLSPIPMTPNMTMETLVSALNQNFQQLEAENRTKIIKDEQGTNRILIGRAPSGKYVIAVSVKGTDVLKALEE